MIGAVHIEQVYARLKHPWSGKAEVDFGHRISRGWDVAEQRFVNRAAKNRGDAFGHCAYPNALRVPGSAGPFQRKVSDGRATRISMKHRTGLRLRCAGG